MQCNAPELAWYCTNFPTVALIKVNLSYLKSGAHRCRWLCLGKTVASKQRVGSQSIQCCVIAAGHLEGLFGGKLLQTRRCRRGEKTEEERERCLKNQGKLPKSAGQSLPSLRGTLHFVLLFLSSAFFSRPQSSSIHRVEFHLQSRLKTDYTSAWVCNKRTNDRLPLNPVTWPAHGHEDWMSERLWKKKRNTKRFGDGWVGELGENGTEWRVVGVLGQR